MSCLGAIVDCIYSWWGGLELIGISKGREIGLSYKMICILPALPVKDHLQMPHRAQGYRGPNGTEDVLAERPGPLPGPQHRSQECQPTVGPRLHPTDPPPLPQVENYLASSLYQSTAGPLPMCARCLPS